MKINFSKKEYRLLLDMLYLSDWVMHSHTVTESEQHSEHAALRKKLLSYYKEMGAEDLITYSKNSDDYVELDHYGEALHKEFIVFYDKENFWENLIDQLSQRDLINAMGEEKYYATPYLEKAEQLAPLEVFYAHEFETEGLKNLEIRDKKGIKH